MKFICTECDEAMSFEATPGIDDDGSLPVTFRCPSCDWGVTLLTNPQETQMVRTLGVKIGGAEVAPPPMDMMRSFLKSGTHPAIPTEGTVDKAGSGSKCPFTAMVQGLETDK